LSDAKDELVLFDASTDTIVHGRGFRAVLEFGIKVTNARISLDPAFRSAFHDAAEQNRGRVSRFIVTGAGIWHIGFDDKGNPYFPKIVDPNNVSCWITTDNDTMMRLWKGEADPMAEMKHGHVEILSKDDKPAFYHMTNLARMLIRLRKIAGI